MSGPAPSANEQKLQLEIEKLSKEVEKLAVEIPKIKREGGWRATVMPSIVSVAAVVVTTTVSLVTLYNAQRSDTYDHEKSDRELALNCVVSASNVAKLVFDSSDKFDQSSTANKINFANVVLAAYPPSVADRFLRSLTPRIPVEDSGSRTAFQVALSRVENASAKEKNKYPCPAVSELLSVDLPTTETPSPPTPTAQPSSPVTPIPAAPSGVSPDDGSQIAAYYQVTRSADRIIAREIAQDVATESDSGPGVRFPSAGVEVVSGAPIGEIEIRYYHRAQEGAAKRLLELVRAAAHQDNGKGKIVFIGGSFPNLPQGRIEVWLPPVDSLYCYQEEDQKKPAEQRYLVLCHPSKQQCDAIRGPNTSKDFSQTSCVVVDASKVGQLKPGGMNGSSFKYGPTPFSAPFPPLP